jgi:hypothetical protein
MTRRELSLPRGLIASGMVMLAGIVMLIGTLPAGDTAPAWLIPTSA